MPRVLVAAILLSAATTLPAADTQPVLNREPLAPATFTPLPLGSITPHGWLRDQLRIQADGFSGHLEEFWPDLGPQSAWLGGAGEGWERGPYYLDGLIPLAYSLKDPALIAKSRKWIDWTLNHQRPDGAIGPEKNSDWWPNMLMLKALTQFQEATADPRVIPFLTKYFAYQTQQLPTHPLKEWAISRWQDEVLSVIWVYNRTGDTSLFPLMQELHRQGHDWQSQYANYTTTGKVPKKEAGQYTHGVNTAMALKAAAVWYEVTGQKSDRDAAWQMHRELDLYHGLPNGIFSADEHLAGLNPSQGTELCTVVEAMFSLETEIAVLGDPAFADRLEKLAFNPLPGTFTTDMWGHQYDQQPNQVACSLSNRDWSTNGPESNIFGLEPNFGCCTANMHQGWPKFTASLWMASPDNGLAAIAYSPNEVHTTLKNTAVSINEETGYPFRDQIRFTVTPQKALAFPLQLRIPAWAVAATVRVNGTLLTGVQPGTFFTIDRTWQPGDRVELTLPMQIRATKWFHNSVAIERGPLVFSLSIGEFWRKEKQLGPAVDWEVFPTTPWNYALELDPQHPDQSLQVEERPIGKQPFNVEGAPVAVKAKGRRLAAWVMENSSAGTLPQSPVTTKQPLEPLTLVPYGAAKLGITSFPYTKQP
jgi:uncharacterized protein